jgi:tetratricopeptide (TPR) repeat protein
MVQRADASPRRRKQLTDEAIRLAVATDWKGAAAANQAILDDFPDDVEAANRLGKALTELGHSRKAIEAYQRALEIDPFNNIARRNLDRLEQASAPPAKAAPKATSKKAAAKSKAGSGTALVSTATAAEFRLQQANPAEVAKLDAGDPATLQVGTRGVAVIAEDGATLGYIEPRAGLRLKRMIEGGNRYKVTIRAVDDDGHAIVFIQETHRDSSLVGQASFLSAAETKRKAPRAYTRRSALIDEDEPDLDYDDGDDDDDDGMEELEDVADVEDIDDDDGDDVDLSNELDDDEDGEDPADVDDDYDPEVDGDPDDDEDGEDADADADSDEDDEED